MGYFDAFLPSKPKAEVTIDASLAPINSLDSIGAPYFATGQTASRDDAMGVPTIARARGIICSTVASLPLETKVRATDETVDSVRFIKQPDPRITGAEFWAWIAEDLLFRPAAYAYVMSRYADTGRIQAAERIAPERVGVVTNSIGTQVEGYTIDGRPVAAEDLMVFGNIQEGLLNRAGRTVRAAHALEKAAYDFALNPIPQIVLSSNGVTLPKDRVTALINAFRSKVSKAVTFLNADVKMDTIGYDPKNLQLNEARQYLSLELCRAIGLPAWFASADPSSMTYSNAINQRRDLIDFSIRPILTVIEQRLSLTDVTPASQYIRYDLDDFLRGNPYERAQVYQILSSIGAMTIDEIRKEEDMIA